MLHSRISMLTQSKRNSLHLLIPNIIWFIIYYILSIYWFKKYIIYNIIWFTMLCQFLLNSKVTQRYTHIHIYIYIYIYTFFFCLFLFLIASLKYTVSSLRTREWYFSSCSEWSSFHTDINKWTPSPCSNPSVRYLSSRTSLCKSLIVSLMRT